MQLMVDWAYLPLEVELPEEYGNEEGGYIVKESDKTAIEEDEEEEEGGYEDSDGRARRFRKDHHPL